MGAGRPAWPLAAVLLAGAAIGLVPPASLLARSWRARVAVEGHSMDPTLRAGDWLLVDPAAYAGRLPAVGELVVASDPRASDRLLVKRVAALNRDGTLRLAGDHPAHVGEAGLTTVSTRSLVGRPWFRYAPVKRIRRLR